MTTRYLIGRAELLTYPIEAPKKKVGDKVSGLLIGDHNVSRISSVPFA